MTILLVYKLRPCLINKKRTSTDMLSAVLRSGSQPERMWNLS